jgi:hypothetical protein
MQSAEFKVNSDKSELISHIWVIGSAHLTKSNSILGVGISADLTVDRHVTKIARQCFYQQRQRRSVRQSLDTDFIKYSTCNKINLLHISIAVHKMKIHQIHVLKLKFKSKLG